MSTVRVRVLRAFMLDRNTIAEPGQVLELDPLTAYSLDRSKAEILDDLESAKMLIDAAAKAHNDLLPRAPRGSLLPAESTPAWRVIPLREPAYGPSRYN